MGMFIWGIIATGCLVLVLSIILPPLFNDLAANWRLKRLNPPPERDYKNLNFEESMSLLARKIANAIEPSLPVHYKARSFIFDGHIGSEVTIRVRLKKFPWPVVLKAENNYLGNWLRPGRLYIFNARVSQECINPIICDYEENTGFQILHRRCRIDRSQQLIYYKSLPDDPVLDTDV